MHLLRSYRLGEVYKIEEMDERESLELFSWHAFKQPSPKKDFATHSTDVIAYSGRLPLALEVLGSYLSDFEITEWQNVLKKLKRTLNDEVYKKLKVSFDGLKHVTEKQTFLDIASFFIGMDKNVLETLNRSTQLPTPQISLLEDKSLLTVDKNNKIQMHVLLQAMAREIIKRESSHTSVRVIGNVCVCVILRLALFEPKLYDVFLSFRGDDSRSKFVSHLYSSLQNAGIYAFKEDAEIQRGDQISLSLLQAIELSRISIVVLSKNYANSRWCMLELEKIMETGRTKGLVVVPVFYK
ncbi:NBS-LRR resistance protein, partial [Trifolium medium]|nr:NBS-LRR resistance protein [Trifolium medium]